MSTHAGPNIVEDGLVLYLDAANEKSYPGTGTAWTDLISSDNNGTLFNGVGYNGSNQGSLTFDGSNDYVSTNFLHNELGLNFSMSCWIKTSVTQLCGLMGFRVAFGQPTVVQRQMYITGDSTAATTGNYLNYDEWTFQNGAANPIRSMFINSISITTGNWINIVATSDPTKSVIYYNSVKIQERISQQPTQRVAAPLVIGRASNWSSGDPTALLNDYAFNGNISDVMMYNKTLSESEVKQNFNSLRGRYGI